MKAAYLLNENGEVKEYFVGFDRPPQKQFRIKGQIPKLLSTIHREGRKWIVTAIASGEVTCRQIMHG